MVAAQQTLVDLLVDRAERQSNQLAYCFRHHGPTAGPRGSDERMTYGELFAQATALAAELQTRRLEQRPVLLLFRPGLDFLRAYFACVLSGAIAAPLRPAMTASEQNLILRICDDAKPGAILTTTPLLDRLRALLEGASPAARAIELLCADHFDPHAAAAWAQPARDPAKLALLQYTSGSTSTPKGVMVSHENLLHNQSMIRAAFGHDRDSVVAGWLPMFHDMGLIGNVLQPLYLGVPSYLMDPMSFVQNPLRWLELISDSRATTSGGPNFGYDLCVRRVGAEEKERLDLSRWSLAFTGAEPVRMETLRRFTDAFAVAGFKREAFFPCYGLAEATLFVTGVEKAAAPSCIVVDRAALGRHEVADVAADDPARIELVCCGRPSDLTVQIVDPETRRALDEGEVGEIWVAGRSKAQGYWNRQELTRELFRARLEPDAGVEYLRTGDLGFVRNGELYISGRLKELIIVRGRNHYPEDIEATVAALHDGFRRGSAAAFAIEVEGEERVVVVQELKRDAWEPSFEAELMREVRAALQQKHGLALHDLALVAPRAVPKTSSGKLQRTLCKALYQAGTLKRVKPRPIEERENSCSR